jgi:hypothetical protein
MKTKFLILIIGSLVFVCSSCTKSFVPEIERYDELVVVDGVITDAPGPYTIKLSKAAKVQAFSKAVPYPKCKLGIEDDLGNKISVTESEPGTYKTDSLTFRGVAGRKYKLSISTPDGESYESATEELLKPVEIQSVYAQQEHKDDPNLFYGRDGYQFYVDAKTPATANNYILWRMQCTYKFSLEFLIHHYYDGAYHFVYNKDTLQTCYRTIDILDVYLLNTQEFQQTEIKKVPLNYEDNYTKALTIRYSLKVSQFTLNESAFEYWSKIKKMMHAGGELYTTQPYQIRNNLVNLTHPDKPALGYFMVAGLSEKRIFVNHPTMVNRIKGCDPPDPNEVQPTWFEGQPAVWPVFFGQHAGHGYYMPQECLDCRLTGTKIKPAFWED